jgi:hypothetical protein
VNAWALASLFNIEAHAVPLFDYEDEIIEPTQPITTTPKPEPTQRKRFRVSWGIDRKGLLGLLAVAIAIVIWRVNT